MKAYQVGLSSKQLCFFPANHGLSTEYWRVSKPCQEIPNVWKIVTYRNNHSLCFPIVSTVSFLFRCKAFNGELTFTASIQATAQIHLEEGYVEDEEFPSSSSTCFTAPRYKPTMAGELSEGQGSQLACCAQSSSVFQGDFNKIYVMFIKCVVL